MAFSLVDKWVWDFWLVSSDGQYHMFFLQADKSLGDPELRHWNVSVGHAISTNLRDWRVVRDAIAPSKNETSAADSCTTWTGSVIKKGALWYLFYTGTSLAENGKVQRVCLATSNDLFDWTKQPENPLLELDPLWYDGLDFDRWHDASWRDPWVLADGSQDGYRMLVTCRINHGENDGRGAIGQAFSKDLLHWTAAPPLLAPGNYGEMEVPQIEKINGRYYLFCTVSDRHASLKQKSDPLDRSLTGLLYYVSEHIDGPYQTLGDGFLLADKIGKFYAARVIQGFDEQWYVMAFFDRDAEGKFVGGISDPIAINIMDDGRLSVANPG